MAPKVLWLFVFVAIYWAYCTFWGIKGALSSKTASDYFLAGRRIPLWVFVLAATATSFSGWTFVGHPGLIYRDGLQYAYASFYAITIPLTGVVFLKRQWILGKRFGFVTPGEMFGEYYSANSIRLLTLLVAMVFSVPYLGVQLRASGFLFHVLTDGLLSVEVGMWALSAVVVAYVASGGLKAVAYVDTMQAVLLALGIVGVGVIALNAVGGWDALNEGLARLADWDPIRTPDGHSHYLAMPGAIQLVAKGADAVGGAWTGTMCLTYMFALMGIQSSPAFSMWAFSNRDPRPFAPQQVWASSLGIGAIMIVFTAIQGLSGHLLGLDRGFAAAAPNIVHDIFGKLTGGQDLMQMNGKQGMLVPQLINLVSEQAPWLVGLLAVCALAAMQSTGSGYMSTASAMLTRDLYKRFVNPEASDAQQKRFGRIGVFLVVGAALIVATTSSDALVLLGGLAVAYGLQMWPSLIGACWWPFLTAKGVSAGLVAGLIGVTCTESVGTQWLGIRAWGRWPLTAHSAGWGIVCNLLTAIGVSHVTQDAKQREHRLRFHEYLRSAAALPPHKRRLVPVGWALVLLWFWFGVGPGATIGNTAFG